MDPFSDLIDLLRPHTAHTKSITARGKWGVRFRAYGKPSYAIVLEGQCWLALDGEEPALLERGDFVLLPATPAFAIYSDATAPRMPVEPTGHVYRYGESEGEPDLAMLGGSFEVEPVNAALLLSLLPRMIHIGASEGGTGRLSRLIALIMEECASEGPGKEAILVRLLEVLMVECLRSSGRERQPVSTGLLSGLGDAALAPALRALHGDVRGPWTVAGLARLAGMSRSAFALRFSQRLGCGPLEYLARWRMILARDALSRGGKPLERLAEEIGYESASAFSTAFRRRVGCSPGAFARAQRAGNGVEEISATSGD
ncbi:AraC family transcriptional regulator [Nordella sp. HKS 07]|uniref:AraC family transcriptional regulator n=1 Tax=Nordella sp. HKS 07 TaxID=2712222 RepID=UPI0013E17F85|nr:AraC family transcriptional regulator [Nordella sp. HKS 07]QIG50505.1 AraC family transcriptional regulator [Nordella sp. HKS 07]